MTPSDRPRGVTVRGRILASILLVVAIALSVIILLTGKALFTKVETDAAAELGHEATKLRAFAEGIDPGTGAAFTSTEMLLVSYLTFNVPEQNETLFSVVNGLAHRRSSQEPLARLDLDAAFIDSVASAESPRSGRKSTAAGPAVYAVLPVRVEGDPSAGELVVIEFLSPAHDEVWFTILTMAIGAAAALLLAGAVGWLVAGRTLKPIRDVQQTAARISGSDLGRRIEVVGRDDVAQLAVTFNGMLDRLETAFDGQRRFLDDAGHELRTPITVVRGHLELMGDDPAEQRQILRLVEDELSRMSRLVDDLILLARSERPDFLMLGRVALTDLVVETLAKATAIADRRWSLDAVPEGTAIADGQRLTQALLQLATNAAAHSHKGDTIAIGGAITERRLRLWVRDEGSGVPVAEQSRIFERFTRGANARKRPGSGLGLAIVARIAEAHGGQIQLTSNQGEGSLFLMDLPYRTTEEHS